VDALQVGAPRLGRGGGDARNRTALMIVRDRDAHRGEAARLELPGHVPGRVEPPLTALLVAAPALRLAESPGRRRDAVPGQPAEEGPVRRAALLVRAQAIEPGRLVDVRLGAEVERGEHAPADRAGWGELDREDLHRQR